MMLCQAGNTRGLERARQRVFVLKARMEASVKASSPQTRATKLSEPEPVDDNEATESEDEDQSS